MSRIPRRASAARTAVSYTTGVLLAALSVGALTSCAVDHSETVPALERDLVAADELNPDWDTEMWHGGSDTDTSRYLGADPEGYEYYVTLNRNGGYCLVISADKLDTHPFDKPHDTWQFNCTTNLPLEVRWHHITATLHPHGQVPHGEGTDVIADQISVRR